MFRRPFNREFKWAGVADIGARIAGWGGGTGVFGQSEHAASLAAAVSAGLGNAFAEMGQRRREEGQVAEFWNARLGSRR